MKVLLVEDSRTQARRFQSALASAGMEVTTRHDGAEGLRAAQAEPFDVVVSDVMMPELDGWELCLALRADERTAAVPIVVMTSLTDPDDVLRALAAGADGYVGKPFEDEVLVDRVRLVADRRRAPLQHVEIHGRALPITASRETILSVLSCALEDASSRHAELAASRARLEKSKAQQDEMIGVVAHELRTPLNVLLLRAGLEEAGAGERQAQGRPSLPALSELVARNVRAMSTIVDDLLDVARIESGSIRVIARVGDLAALANEVARRFEVVSARHPVEVEASRRVDAVFDAARVEQVIANLLSNAIKYSPDGGRIVVRVETQDGLACVVVEDEGIGIPEGVEERLFGRYVRAPGSENVAKGVGLGLYISRRLVELQGGTIGAARRDEKGSRFWFTVPLAR
ncbi:MAG: hybrid sensor histidine kinase/response regulator [Myxococcota bacterium]|nr:hybrid sensor histidine kinase/response regulator [Myxococcota bacterium]